jgi:hypothetical protein
VNGNGDLSLLAKFNVKRSELGTRLFLRFALALSRSLAELFALALSRSLAELFALALSRSFLGLKFRAFAFALPRSLIFRVPKFFALFFALLDFSRSYIRNH